MRLAVVIPVVMLAGAGPVTFSGRFILNAEKSEDARQKLHQSMEGREGHRSGGYGGGTPGGGHGGGGWGSHPGGGEGHRHPEGAPGSSSGDARESMRAVFDAPAEMTITDTDNEVVILEKEGRMRSLHPDGKSEKAEGSGDEVKTRRDGARLIVETKPARGGKITETFTRDPEHHQVDVLVLLENASRPPLSIRRVYDDATPER